MGVGGVILGSLGLLIVTLVANHRWDAVWAAMLGGSSSTGSGASGTITHAIDSIVPQASGPEPLAEGKYPLGRVQY